MTIKIGINGFGRIGRLILRTCLDCSDIEVAAINDPAINVEYICYLIKYDSTHGKFKGEINYIDDIVFINGKSIKVFHQKHPSSIPWQLVNVRYVIEASGMFTTTEKAIGHLANESVRRVIVTAPSSDIPIVILGVNDDAIYSDSRIISNASSTLYCLAPIVKVLEDKFGIQEGFITCIHAMTPSLKPLDGLCVKGKHWRDHRSIHQNIIPTSTGACRTLSKILPQTKDKLTGIAFRVPIVDVSVLDLTVRLESNTNLREILRAVDVAGTKEMRNIIKISKDLTVSSDYIGDSYSCILDAQSSLQLRPNFFKLVCWYENEYSYACRLVDVLRTYNARSNSMTIQAMSLLKLGKPTDEPKKRLVKTEKLTNVALETRSIKDSAIKMKPSIDKHLFSIAVNDVKSNNEPETIQIWNEEPPTPDTKQNKSFLENIVNKSFNSKTQEKLERIRRDFSKMLNITEDLLKKSLSKSLDLGNRGDVDICNERKQITDQINHEKPVLEAPSSGDTVIPNPESETVTNELKENVPKSSNPTLDTSICSFSHDISHYDIYDKKYDLDKSEDIIEMQATKSNITLNGDNTTTNHNNKTLNSTSTSLRYHSPTRSRKSSLSPKRFQSLSPKRSPPPSPKRERKLLRPDSYSNTMSRNRSPERITNKNVKHGNRAPAVTNSSSTEKQMRDFEQVSTQLELLDMHKKNQTMDEMQIGYLKKIFKQTIYKNCQRQKGTSSNGSSSGSVRVPISGVDIYDKLESASVTDSDNSFYVYEKKSQIIDIDELTKSSSQDIKRLDNICRIIEISDELSDRLFANLDDEKDSSKKKWSFKELCDKIKLDDFCESLLNKTNN